MANDPAPTPTPAQTSVPTPTPTPTPTPAAFDASALNGLQGDAFRAIIPDEIRAKPYMKDINTFGDFIKKFDGAQTMIGQRTTPGENADPKEWEAFHIKAGRPEKAELYTIPKVEGLPADFLQKHADDINAMKLMLHASGANQYQMNVFATNMLKAIHADEQETDKKFHALMDSTFGQDAEALTEKGKAFLAGVLPDSVKALLPGLDPKALGILMVATDAIVKKHVSPDGFRGAGGAGGGGTEETKEALVARMKVIMQDPAYIDPFKDKAKNAAFNTEMDQIRTKLKKFS